MRNVEPMRNFAGRATVLFFALLVTLFCAAANAQVSCPCDAKEPATLKERQCALCAEAEKQPAGSVFFFVKDTNPLKPDRWLTLSRQHSTGITIPLTNGITVGPHQISALPAATRAEVWRAAFAKAKELWGDQWGVAYNAEKLHTQCHVHIHIGKLIDGVEWGEFKVVNGPEEIPLPGTGGLWIHPVDGKLHVHLEPGETENVLLR